MNKKWVYSATSTLLLLSVILEGCSGGSPAAQQVPGNQDSGKSSGRIPIELLQVGYGVNMPKPENDFVKKQLDEKMNIDLKMTLTMDAPEMIQKLNLRAASQDMPDIIMFANKNDYSEYARRGLLLELTPAYMNKLADVKATIGDLMFDRAKVNGKVFGYVRNANSYHSLFWVRKDWLDKLNLKMPTTLDEVMDVAKAFVEKDPDGNGKKDTMGITSELKNLESKIFTMHGVVDGFYKKNDQMVDGLYQPEMRNAMQYLQKMIASGIVDPELPSNKVDAALDKAFQGKAGILVTGYDRLMKDDTVKKWKGVNPNAEWAMIKDLKGPGGNTTMAQVDYSSSRGYIGIAKGVGSNPDKLNKIFELANYTAKGDGLALVHFGLKDVHYKIDNGKVTPTDKGSEAEFVWAYQLGDRVQKDFLSGKYPQLTPYIEYLDKVPLIDTYNGFVSPPDGFNLADANRYKDEEMLKFLYGKTKMEQYDQFLKTLDTTFKYQTYTDSAMKQFKENGITSK